MPSSKIFKFQISEIDSVNQERILPNPLAFREFENLSGPSRVIDARNPRISLFRWASFRDWSIARQSECRITWIIYVALSAGSSSLRLSDHIAFEPIHPLPVELGASLRIILFDFLALLFGSPFSATLGYRVSCLMQRPNLFVVILRLYLRNYKYRPFYFIIIYFKTIYYICI